MDSTQIEKESLSYEDVVVDLEVAVLDVAVVVESGHVHIGEGGFEPCRLVVGALVLRKG